MAAPYEDDPLRPAAGSHGPHGPGGTPLGPSGAGSSAGDGEARCKPSQSPENCGKPPAASEAVRTPHFPSGRHRLAAPSRTASKVVCVHVDRLEQMVLVDPDPAPMSFPILVRGRDLVAGSGRIRAAVLNGDPAELPTIDLLHLPAPEAEALVSFAAELAELPDHRPEELNALADGVLARARALLEEML